MNRRFRAIGPTEVAQLVGRGSDADLAHAPWLVAAHQSWGFCGVVNGTVDDPRGWVLVAPVGALPEDHPLTLRASAPEVAGLIALKTDGTDRACPRQVVQVLAGRLVGKVARIEAVASSWRPDSLWTDGLLPSVSALTSAGFERVDEDSAEVDPLMRLDLHTTVLAHWTDRARDWAPHWWTRMPPAEPSRRQPARLSPVATMSR